MPKKNIAYEEFMAEHLPKVPDFVEGNRPRFEPSISLGPPSAQPSEKNLIDFYLQGDVRPLQNDIYQRPEHYTQEQKDIVEALAAKKPLPPGTPYTALNDLVLRLTETSDHRAKREKVIQKAQKAVEEEDPTVARALRAHEISQTFENQEALPKAIKII